MNINKSHWITDNDTVRLQMPIAKVDTEKREVSGFATLDNIDSHGDIVLAEASAKAFARFRGNIREMHQPIAAGRLVDFREDEFYHDGQFYRGIYVTAYVSRGAQDTWEKVLDGTLTGFSIGGSVIESSSEFVKDANGGEGAMVRFIKDYDLIELSLVDNPANQLANVFSIQKSAEGSVTLKGMVADTKVENVFYCETDGIAKTDSTAEALCSICGTKMKNIGWLESGENKTEKVRSVVAKFLSPDEDAKKGEGGVEMSVNANEPVEPVEEAPVEAVAEETPVEEAPVEEPVAEEPVAEVEKEEDSISKMIDDLKAAVEDSLEKTRTTTTEAVEALEDKVEGLNKSLEEKTSEMLTKYNELSEKLSSVKEASSEVEKRLEAIESATAIKKSVDGEPLAEQKQKNLWGGAFSVDNLVG